ncbi:helix-turn-helix domain-containing protein [Duganella sp. FT50W]|uniref:Helix-turn-helix domain-containing protein n=1 Tax=Duganella lactea TaxID=2692173 RepID=A0A6L8MPF6_9BURK|nr:helix-turn-helix transcriptional regulator [Duganella lactea]MYM84321.1 helix-turn-helix domain-containing protein [Duganella lactea]
MEQLNESSTPREIFARNLRLVRRLKDISQEQLALDANLSRTYVSEVERAGRNISIDNMGHLANALGVELKDLLDANMLYGVPPAARQSPRGST